MSVFQVSSRTLQPSSVPKRRSGAASKRWYFILQRGVGSLAFITLALLLFRANLYLLFFLLLPVNVSLVISRSQISNLVHGTLLYSVFWLGLALLYFGIITGIQALIHTPGFGLLAYYRGPAIPQFIVVTTTLTWSVLLAPLYTYGRAFIDQRFNRQNHETTRAIEAFTTTLREEIDLDRLCDGLLSVVQKTMRTQSISVWVRKTLRSERDNGTILATNSAETASGYWRHEHSIIGHAEDAPQRSEPAVVSLDGVSGGSPLEITISDDDPFTAYILLHSDVVEVSRLHLDSSLLQILQANEVEMVLPLANQGQLVGLLCLGARPNKERYTHADRSLLKTLAVQVAPALRVAQLVQEQQTQVREHERMEQELRTAQDIQRTYLPKEVPAYPGWQIMRYYQPAREVGGDFYDFLPFADGRLGLVIGDVAGKGVPAALVMMATRTMLRTVAREHTSPSEVLAQVNDLLFADIPTGMFVTCFYVVLDPRSGHLHYANAGHELPYYQHNENVTELWATGMPLGMMPETSYEEYEITLAPDERLLFYSDGLVEAHNSVSEMFGFPRLKTALEGQRNGEPLIEGLLGKLKHFTGIGWEQEDDVTIVTLYRAPSL
jgi:serine phosphatase RsbU (regulator of sigma subunit)